MSLPSACLAADYDEILAVLQANFAACNAEDADALMRTCSIDMPDRQKFRRESVKLWREKDIHYSLVEFKILELDGDYAVAEVVQMTHCDDRKSSDEKERSFRNGTTLLTEAEKVRYMAAFKKDFGRWKCYMTISEPVPER